MYQSRSFWQADGYMVQVYLGGRENRELEMEGGWQRIVHMALIGKKEAQSLELHVEHPP